jgi:hypothetical protein
MGQPRVIWCGNNYQDYTITISVHDRRVEFFIRPDIFRSTDRKVRDSIDKGFFNQACTILLTAANMIHFQGEVFMPGGNLNQQPWMKGKPMGNKLPEPEDYCKTPSDEYPFTLIAPTAKNGLIYQGQRYWHKTIEAAQEYATYIYDANPTEKFDLSIVEWQGNIRPKPMIELQLSMRQKTPAS